MKLEVRLGRSRKWYWRIISTKNGKVICHSETYSSRAKADKTAEAVLKWAKSL